jgi:hypothetical protein
MVFIVVMKQALDSPSNNSTKVNFELLYDIKVFHGLAMLKQVNSLMEAGPSSKGFFFVGLAYPGKDIVLSFII